MKHTKADDEAALVDSRLYSFTEEDQIEQLQKFVDWLHDQRVSDPPQASVSLRSSPLLLAFVDAEKISSLSSRLRDAR